MMGITWYPEGLELDVPNPGYGELIVTADAQQYAGRALVTEDWQVRLTGADIGAFLAAVTARAVGGPKPEIHRHPDWDAWSPSDLPGWCTQQVARDLLPALQRAVLLAVAGTDRFDRTYYAQEEGPHEPLCANCNEGSDYTPTGPASCAEYGHSAFGARNPNFRWAPAQERYTWARERWQQQQQHRGDGVPAVWQHGDAEGSSPRK
jgi:hypothetical protein